MIERLNLIIDRYNELKPKLEKYIEKLKSETENKNQKKKHQ